MFLFIHCICWAVINSIFFCFFVLLNPYFYLSSPTVRSLGPFSTVGEGCIPLDEVEPRPLHPAEATTLVGPLPREKRSFWCPASQCPKQNRMRSSISVGNDGRWLSNWVTSSGCLCGTEQHPGWSTYNPAAHALLCAYNVHSAPAWIHVCLRVPTINS